MYTIIFSSAYLHRAHFNTNKTTESRLNGIKSIWNCQAVSFPSFLGNWNLNYGLCFQIAITGVLGIAGGFTGKFTVVRNVGTNISAAIWTGQLVSILVANTANISTNHTYMFSEVSLFCTITINYTTLHQLTPFKYTFILLDDLLQISWNISTIYAVFSLKGFFFVFFCYQTGLFLAASVISCIVGGILAACVGFALTAWRSVGECEHGRSYFTKGSHEFKMRQPPAPFDLKPSVRRSTICCCKR